MSDAQRGFAPEDGDVMVALAPGWPTRVEDRIDGGDAAMWLRAAAGREVPGLCPDQVLAGFERAAAHGGARAAARLASLRTAE